MAVKVTAYKARNGKMFTTEEEADAADIRDAAEALAGDDAALRSHIENVALGKSGCLRTRESICLLADAVRKRPVAVAEAPH